MQRGAACPVCFSSVPLRHCGSRLVSRRAFTFFELLLVMVIMMITLGMMAPNLRGFFFAHQTHEKALHLLALMRHARSQAVTQGIKHRLTLNMADREYKLEQQVNGKYVDLGTSLGQTFTWPDTLTITFEADVEQNDPIYLIFTPQGTITPGKITLIGQEEKGHVLESQTSAEPYVLKTIEDDEKETE
jgi:Tfp pilus assembly protein FimT